jgi:hypothetical protein
VLPYSQYWIANNSESDPENFSGTDHLAFFDEGKGRWSTLGDMEYDERDRQLEDSVSCLGWPLVDASVENCAVQCKAGTAVVMTNNTYHRGSRRRDDPALWPQKPRVMWRMWAYRTREPDLLADGTHLEQLTQNWDDVSKKMGVEVPDAAKAVWDSLLAYTVGLPEPSVATDAAAALVAAAEADLFDSSDPISTEPTRCGAAYSLAKAGAAGVDALERGLADGREEVRRCATWGLSALPQDLATPPLLRSLGSGVKSVRKHGAFALGESGAPTAEVVEALAQSLLSDDSTWVRTAAAGALGCVGIKAAQQAAPAAVLGGCCAALVASLRLEVNRDYSGPESWNGSENTLNNPVWDGRHQDASAVHPHVIDMCEGFGPLRSAPRENSLWALVMLCNHLGTAVHELSGVAADTAMCLAHIVQTDPNGYSAGHAMDALRRLAASSLAVGDRTALGHLTAAMAAPVLTPCPESLLRTILPAEHEMDIGLRDLSIVERSQPPASFNQQQETTSHLGNHSA